MKMDEAMRTKVLELNKEWKMQPFITLACAGYADEHWQIWHPSGMRLGGMPRFVVLQDGTVEAHPDAKKE